jgi:hypothetical protein
MMTISIPIVITIGAVAGCPRRPAPIIAKPIMKKRIVKNILLRVSIPSLVRVAVFFAIADSYQSIFLNLCCDHLKKFIESIRLK